nr:hypothetical protein [Tanacetum cinerariifolium]
MSKDQSISRRNKIFWHTARDDPMFNMIRVISIHQDTQIYDAILANVLTNQEMLDSKAYKEYYAVASGAEPPKAKTKYKKKADEPVISLKKKLVQATKGTRLKSKAKVTKPDKKKQPAKKTKAKDLAVLFKVALSEAEQIKLATKRSKKDFHISHASGSGDGVDTQLKVPREQQQKTFSIDEGTGTIPGVLDVPPYKSKSDKESWGDSEDEDDNADDNQTEYEEEDVEERARTPSDNELTNKEKLDDEESMDDEEDDEKNLYNELVESYNSDTDIITSYGDVVLLKKGRDDQDKDEDPLVGSDRGMKRRKSEEPSHTVEELGMQQDQEFIMGDNNEQPIDKETWITQAAFAEEPPTSFNKFKDTSFDFSAFVLNRLKIPNLTQEILVGPAFNLLKGTCKSITELEYHLEECSKATTEQLDWHNPENKLIITVTRLTIMKKYDYGHLEEIEVHLDDQQLYTFKEDVLSFKYGWKIFNYVSKVTKEAQSHQLNTFSSNLKNKTTYTSHSDPHGIIYVDQFKRKRLMRTDELHKFSDGTLNDVRTDIYDIAVGIRMDYLPMQKWSNLDKKRAWVMVQDIDKQLYHRRLMRNLEKFVGGIPYGEDLRLLERTI